MKLSIMSQADIDALDPAKLDIPANPFSAAVQRLRELEGVVVTDVMSANNATTLMNELEIRMRISSEKGLGNIVLFHQSFLATLLMWTVGSGEVPAQCRWMLRNNSLQMGLAEETYGYHYIFKMSSPSNNEFINKLLLESLAMMTTLGGNELSPLFSG